MAKNVFYNRIHSVKFWAVNVLLSLVVSFVFSVGSALDKNNSWQVTDRALWLHFWTIFVVTLVVLIVLSFAKISLHNNSKITKKVYIIPLITWTLSLLACFPGVFSYDCYEEWKMVADNQITNHHPYLHVILLGGLTELSNSLYENGNVGILAYVLIQMFFGLFVISKVCEFLHDRYDSVMIEWIAVAFYSLSPVVLMYIIATTKDSVFSLFELYFIAVCLEFVENDAKSKRIRVDLVISSLGTMIFRKNGLYIAAISLFVLTLIKRKEIKRLISPLIVITVLYFIYSVPLSRALSVGSSSSAEMLSIPIQQMARVYNFEKDSLSATDIEYMYKYIDKEFWEKYIPTTADAVKMGFKQLEYENDKSGFFKTWARIGNRHPMTYLNAWLANTVDYWYPLAVIDGYKWLYGMDESKSNFFDYRVAEPGKEIDIIRPLHEVMRLLSEDKDITKNPLVSIFLNPGWYVLLWVFSLAYSIKEGKKHFIIFHIIMASSLLTVLMGPMALVRYVFIFYLVVPIEVAIFVC